MFWLIAGIAGGFQQAQGDSLVTSHVLELRLNVWIVSFHTSNDLVCLPTGQYHTSKLFSMASDYIITITTISGCHWDDHL